MTEPAAASRASRKVRIGTVVSNKMKKTIVVRVNRLVKHPKYQRIIRQSSTFKAHDETNSAAIGDWVKIMETRPLSKDKRWRLVEIVRRASTAPAVPGGEEEPADDRTKTPQMTADQQPSSSPSAAKGITR